MIQICIMLEVVYFIAGGMVVAMLGTCLICKYCTESPSVSRSFYVEQAIKPSIVID